MEKHQIKQFTITEKEAAQIEEFINEVNSRRADKDAGAIGGATTYLFTPTDIGMIFVVRHFGEELNLTDYENW